MTKTNNYDLENRTLTFSKEIIHFCKKLKQDTINKPLILQLVRSATSIGANYHEANGASSKKDFRNKIYICKKEAKETKYWLQLILESNPEAKDNICKIIQESQEFIFIFSKIISTINKN